jgi:transposase-like protein
MKRSNEQLVKDYLQKAFTAESYEDMLSHLLNLLAFLERTIYIQNTSNDKGNGFRTRKLHAGSLTFDLLIPRTRNGNFRPFFLPEKWKRTSPQDFMNLAHALILSSKSIEAAKRAIKELGLPITEEYLEEVLNKLQQEFRALNSSPLPPDWFSLTLDAKETSVMSNGVILPYTLYTVIGTSLDGERRVLLTLIKEGKENLEGWKEVLKNLLSRGVRRVLIATHDDFSGLSKLVKSYFPEVDVQLCLVHFVRNLKKQLPPEAFKKAKNYVTAIKDAVSYEHGVSLLKELMMLIKEANPSYFERVSKKEEFFVPFLKYPKEVRRSLYSTNLAESINRKIEDAEQLGGGYFHSIRNLEVRLALVVKELHCGRWKKRVPVVAKVKHFLHVLFEERFGDG